ncbi:apolipoprotein L3-like [Watersipora subatra]|uniref:apolipoprotein L3-like n=1 Tax=Watersipora subatra TaxID=2589382 RepID=UPI00355B7A90
MGIKFSKSTELTENEKQLSFLIEDWITLRNKTICELSRVADELDDIHKKATYSKIAGGVAGAVGGGLAVTALALSFFTGGTSLLLAGTGLTIAAGGGVTATLAEVVEYLKKKTRVDSAQKALEIDKSAQAELLSKIETTIDTSNIGKDDKAKAKIGLTSFIDGLQLLWASGLRIYGMAKTGKAVYSTAKFIQTGSSLWKLGATRGLRRTLMTVGGGLAGSLFFIVDIGYVIHHTIEVKKGNPSDAAKSLRRMCSLLREERDKIIHITQTH